MRPLDAVHVELDGKRLINFAANDYLGLTHHPRIVAAMQSAAGEFGAGAGAAGLISGFSPAHQSAENQIARWKNSAAAVLLPSGYQANHAAVQTLAALPRRYHPRWRSEISAGQTRARIPAGCRPARSGSGSGAFVHHNHLGETSHDYLSEADREEIQVVVTESIFSMDGDAGDLAGIAKLKQQFNFVLLVDEAHASGVYGANALRIRR